MFSTFEGGRGEMEREEKKKRREGRGERGEVEEGRGERGGNSPDLIADSLGAGGPLVPVLLGIHSSEGRPWHSHEEGKSQSKQILLPITPLKEAFR